MSKISLTPNASGTGTFTIASPNSNTSRTLTLPDADGALLTDGSSLDAGNLTGTLPAIDGSAVTALTANNLTGALPAIDGSALTGISTTPTTAQVLTATAGSGYGDVGTYAYVVYYGGELYAGNTIAGSSIRPVTISKSANVTSSVGTTVAFGSEESVLSGTWRLMSSARYSGTRSYGILALRIS